MVEATAGFRSSRSDTARSSTHAVKTRAEQSGVADPLKVQVNLYVKGHKLKDLDRMSKSDPMCVIFEKKQS